MNRLLQNRSRLERNGEGNSLELSLHVTDPNVVCYLEPFEPPEQTERALEALRVGVIALQSASPTLDTKVVQKEFGALQSRLKDGLDDQIGPKSTFGQRLDPANKDGLLCLIQAKVSELVDSKLGELLKEFSFDEKESAISTLRAAIVKEIGEIQRALGVESGKKAEEARGHAKGFDFETHFYDRLAVLCRTLGDETECVRAIPGACGRKYGDHVATLGETTGAPGLRIVFETKNQSKRLKDAREELQKAKENREAACGIFVFAKGNEPAEVGDILREGDDYYCTVDKELLESGGPLVYLEGAYKLARTLLVARVRKEADGGVDLEAIRSNVDALTKWLEKMGDIARQAKTVKGHGESIDKTASDMQKDMDLRLNQILVMLGASDQSTP